MRTHQDRLNEVTRQTYPTVIAWPSSWTPAQIPKLLASTGAIDEPTARLAANRTPPMILGRFQPEQAAAITQRVLHAGGDAFAPTLADIAGLGPTLKIRDLRIVSGNLEIDIWRGMTTTIRREHVQFLVRASLRRNRDADRARNVADRVRDNVDRATRLTNYGWAIRRHAQQGISNLRGQAAQTSSKISEALDIHSSNGTVFQVDGDRFAFAILGDMKGHSDRANMDRLSDLIAHISPDEVVDTYFSLFHAPAGHHHLLQLLPELRKNNEHPAFAFYSRWAALMYRHVMGV